MNTNTPENSFTVGYSITNRQLQCCGRNNFLLTKEANKTKYYKKNDNLLTLYSEEFHLLGYVAMWLL
jgi:hypothetical protein